MWADYASLSFKINSHISNNNASLTAKTRKPSCRWQTRTTRKHAKNCSNSLTILVHLHSFSCCCLKLENGWIFPPQPCLTESPARGNPLECRDEIWRQKTRITGLPDGEKIMTLAFFILTQYQRVTDGRRHTLLSQRPVLAQRHTSNITGDKMSHWHCDLVSVGSSTEMVKWCKYFRQQSQRNNNRPAT